MSCAEAATSMVASKRMQPTVRGQPDSGANLNLQRRNWSLLSGDRATVELMEITRLQPDGLIVSPAFSHVAVVPAGATTIYVGGQNGVDAYGKIVTDDVAVQWTVFMAEDADLNAAYEAIGPRLAGPGAPPLVTMARVAALGVPGAIVEVSAIAAVVPR